jgi:hypothetical protein
MIISHLVKVTLRFAVCNELTYRSKVLPTSDDPKNGMHIIQNTFQILLQIFHFLSNALLNTNTTIDLEGGKRLALALALLALAAVGNKI